MSQGKGSLGEGWLLTNDGNGPGLDKGADGVCTVFRRWTQNC